jgi:hypothetical protein
MNGIFFLMEAFRAKTTNTEGKTSIMHLSDSLADFGSYLSGKDREKTFGKLDQVQKVWGRSKNLFLMHADI